MRLWSFTLVDGKCVTQLAAGHLSEEQVGQFQADYNTFMRSIWDERQKKRQDADHAAFLLRENVKEHTIMLDGVECIIRTRGPDNEPFNGYVVVADREIVKTSHVLSQGARSWNVEVFSQRLLDAGKDRNPYEMLRGARGGAIAYKSIEAALRAGIKKGFN
jgi:hypothetical protein